MYVKDYEIRYSDRDSKGNIKQVTALELMQDVSVAHSSEVGFTPQEMLSRNVACLLGGWRVLFNKELDSAQSVSVKTGIMSTKRCEASRKYEIWQGGECRIAATALWFTVNPSVGTVIRIPPEMSSAYESIAEEDNNLPYRNLKPKHSLTYYGESKVDFRDIDSNNHMNNVKSVEMALSFLPDDYELKELQVRYRRELVFGDAVKVYGKRTKKGFYTEIRNKDDEPCVLICGIERRNIIENRRNNMVKIITDSAADFEPAELRELDITCVPMQISFDNETYKENVNLTKDEFYRLLSERDEFPKTSQPTPYEFEEILKENMANGDETVVITISSALSGTYQSASLTKDSLEYENCYVVDSLSATGGQRLLVEYAAKLRDEGKSASEIFDKLMSVRDKITIYACIDTLEYLHKGGRISKTAYAVGSFANIKPIIYVSKEGKVEVAAKALSMRSGINSVYKKTEKIVPDTDYPVYIVYSNDRKNAEILAKTAVKHGFEIPPERIVNIGATIGAHVGSGACGLIYVAK